MTLSDKEVPNSHPDESDLIVRPARPEDRDAVLAFCSRIWDGHDYIKWVWDEWLQGEHGALLVAVAAGRPVGIVHVRMMSADEAWLEGIRVDPEERRAGIGRALTSKALVAARERGAVVARLMTGSTNTPSQGLIARFGFTRIAEMARYTAPAGEHDEAGADIRLITPGEQDFDRIWAWLEQSNLVPLNGGVVIVSWGARALTEPLLRSYLAAGQVYFVEELETIGALALAAPVAAREGDPAVLQVHYLDGMADSIGRLGLALRARAADKGLAEVELWLPDLLILHDAMDGASYERADPDEAMWIYAREL
jgi:ribosomal protein S18 acetylase RimI-like enzyme